MMRQWRFRLILGCLAAFTLAACESSPSASTDGTDTATDGAEATEVAATTGGGSRLDTIRDRGELICGVEGNIPGFSFVDSSGEYSGLDVEVCRAVASAVLGDPDAVQYRNLTSAERFEAMKAGEVDMLSRNTTWTLDRDAAIGMEFAPTTFYDGQGMMVRSDSGIENLEDFEGRSICVETGTTTELNLTGQMRKAGVEFTPLVFPDANTAYAAYAEGRCEGMTSDKSQLLARRSTLPSPEEHELLAVTMSKEPLGPVTINNDSEWFDAVKWSTFALIEAEELGITSENVDEMLNSEDPNVLRFLGAEGSLGEGLGLPNDFAYVIIKNVGNYGEVYDRNLGENSQFQLARGQNALWTDGGLLYSPPFR